MHTRSSDLGAFVCAAHLKVCRANASFSLLSRTTRASGGSAAGSTVSAASTLPRALRFLIRRATLQQQYFCCCAFVFSVASCSMVPATLDDVEPPAPTAYDGSGVATPHSSVPEAILPANVPPLHSAIVSAVHVNPVLALEPQLPTISSPGGWRAGVLSTLRVTGMARPAPSSASLVARSELRRLHTDMQHTHHVHHASEPASRSASARPFRARRPPSARDQPSSQPPASARLPSGLRTRPVIRRHVNACISAGATS